MNSLRMDTRPEERWRAHRAVARAIESGALIRPARCEECGRECKPDAAHEDYSQPLEVTWLCRSCHRRWDQQEVYQRLEAGVVAGTEERGRALKVSAIVEQYYITPSGVAKHYGVLVMQVYRAIAAKRLVAARVRSGKRFEYILDRRLLPPEFPNGRNHS